MLRTTLAVMATLALAVGLAAASPAGDNVVINEIYANPPGTYDGAEFIELYNPTGSAIDISGWVLCGVEYDQSCGGEDRWQFPTDPVDGGPTIIDAGGYLVIAKDGGDGEDGFFEEFGTYCDFEMYDANVNFTEIDNPFVANMILLDDDLSYSDEIQLVGGRGYGIMCGYTSYADVVYLYTGPGLATQVDLVEYMDPVYCSSDPCSGDDGITDDNAFPNVPFLGNTLGRNPSSTDTDNSNVDWTMQAPTPGAQNSLNAPPWIRGVVYAPIPPTSLDSVTVSATVTDDASVDSVMVYYNAGSGWGKVAASAAPGDSLYSGVIGPQLDGAQVLYYVRAVDNAGAGINYPAEGATSPYAYSVGYTDIYDVQFVASGGDASPMVGQSVNLRGIVTAAKGTFGYNDFYIHEGNGAFEGIQVYAAGLDAEINEGDDVTVCGTVSEYYNQTELSLHFPGAVVVHSTGNANYGYADVTTAQVSPANVDAEQFEAQLVRVSDVTVTALPDGYGQWYVMDSSMVACQVDDYGYYTYTPVLSDVLDELRGICMYSFDEFKIEPRSDDDFVGPPQIANLRYAPIPPAPASTITISADMTDNVAITSATLYYATSAAGPFSSTSMSSSRANYSAAIGPYSDGTRVYYYTECSDGATTTRKPLVGSYSFYVGMLDISDVQTVAAGLDASPLDTLAVNVQGVVTAEPGVYSDYYFVIQDGSGAFNGVKVYDRTGSVSFERGDEIIVCGEVAENYGETEIALHFAEGATLVASRAALPLPVEISTSELQTVTSAEKYEGVLVHASDCTVEVADLGNGEFAITNGAAGDTCRVNDDAPYTYSPTYGDNIWVLGACSFSFGNYKIEPRGDEDIAKDPVGVPDEVFGDKFGLAQNAPNPFNPKTTIAFRLPEASDVTLSVYDVSGRKVTTLANRVFEAGLHYVDWNGRDAAGERVASGVYFYKLTAGDMDVSRKMVLLK